MDDVISFAALTHSLEQVMLGMAVCGLRLFAAFSVLPPMSEEFLNGSTRRVVVMLIAVFVAAGQSPEQMASLTAVAWAGLAAKETLIGLLIGWAGSTVFWTVGAVGALIDTQAGFNNVQMTNPLSGEENTPVSHLLLQLVGCLFFIMGGMLVFLGAMFDSFRVWPPLAPWPLLPAGSESVFMAQVDEMMRVTLKFASPALLVLMLIEVGFGLLARAADKLDPHSFAQPVKGLVTMLLLALMAGVFINEVRHGLLPLHLVDQLRTLLPGR